MWYRIYEAVQSFGKIKFDIEAVLIDYPDSMSGWKTRVFQN